MRRGDIVQRTVVVCVVVAVVAFAGLAVAGRPLAGVALAAGLIIGSANGWLVSRSVGMDVSFRASSLGRMAVLTAAGLGVGSLLGLQNAALTIVGLAMAQLLLAGVAARSSLEMLRT